MVYQSPTDFSDAVAVEQAGNGFYRTSAKRLVDILIVLLVSPIVLAVVLPLAYLIARDGKSPFYAQKRIGQNGNIFYMWKLRSMVPDADRMLEAYLETDASARDEWDRFQKLRQDPRITRVGRIIRKTSVDELPQLWNVLRGDMSIVGPRPMMATQKAIYPGHAYYELRPGITGYWQISDRNESSFAERAYHDTQYFDEVSLGADLLVMLRTFRAVFAATGH